MTAARFLLDRSLGGRLLIARLRDAGWDARTLAEEFGDARAQAMSDEEWIASGTASGFVLLAKDHRIASRPLEALAIYMHDARAIAFANGNLTATQMGDLCLEFEKPIHRMASAQPPFVMSLGKGGLRRKNLNAP
ncbi:uncharacterized protein with PIN domain [Microbacterium sp. W4I4]|uniref:PIN-like domain-containing protein n=1 Tax=Microbacterium sp. W4I4 TaxID=3042295 RepID=UPI0027846268|nr:hypothetical protein [Microbacterium sp. W4I4]MDQ0615253.1 uncharacterized protein with PIN domain [Microbacterium sp. W4I4]